MGMTWLLSLSPAYGSPPPLLLELSSLHISWDGGRYKHTKSLSEFPRGCLGFSVALTQAASGRPPVQSRPRGESLARRGASLHQAIFCVGVHNSAYVLSFPLKVPE